MFRVFVGTVTIANIPNRERADYLAEKLGGQVKRIRYKNTKFINYLKENKTNMLHEDLEK